MKTHRFNFGFVPFVALLAVLSATTSCKQNKTDQTTADAEQQKQDSVELAQVKKAATLFGVLPESPVDSTSAVVKLGKRLYFETALSANGEMSCNSCHMLDEFGVDHLPTSPGHEGKSGDRNSPSVYNAWFHIAQFWDGRAADLKEQAKGPILNPIEMGLPSEAAAVRNIKAIPVYTELFAGAFPESSDPITYDNIAGAIAEFEKTLRTPSAFDHYMAGDANALTKEQKAGMATFIESGCITCHMGPGLGGNLFQKFGLINGPYWDYTGSVLQDEGRKAVTGNETDLHLFKVPSLRNVTETAPYFHDGSVSSLKDAVKIMAKTQVGRDLSDEDAESIIVFLESLKGELPLHAMPEMNKSI